MQISSRTSASVFQRRQLLRLLPVPFLAACSVPAILKSSDPMLAVAPFVRKDMVWKTTTYIEFLTSLPPAGLLALKKSLGLVPSDATVASLKGVQVDVFEINTDLCKKTSWFGICRNPADFDYHGIVVDIAEGAQVDAAKMKNASTFEIEHLLMERTFQAIEKDFSARWAAMTPSERSKVLERVDPNGELKDKAALVAGTGGAAVRAVAAIVSLTGFSAYIAATTALSAAVGAVGAVLPFAAYTTLTASIAVISGPVGWLAGAIAGIFSVVMRNRPETQRVAAFILTMHALKLDALHSGAK